MILTPLNLESKLRKFQSKVVSEEEILKEVEDILTGNDKKEQLIRASLNSKEGLNRNKFNFEILETNRIYHISTIKKICIDYRLRFLDSAYFKPEFPQEAVEKIKELEQIHDTEIKGFKIMAPSKLMKLENADDPLLFAPIVNDYFYLIHKWGNDLHPLRKWLYLPFKDINNTLVFSIALSLLLTLMVPSSFYDEANANSQFWFLFLFIFKAVGFVFIFYGVSLGKNFNEQIWNSRYYNG